MSNTPRTIGDPHLLNKLNLIIQGCKDVVVACSGGTDSAFLLWVCSRCLDKNHVKAVTFHSPATPRQELLRAVETAEYLQVEHLLIATPEMEDEEFCANDLLRCYYCKRRRFRFLHENYSYLCGTIMDGTHQDDLNDYRPGMKALKEFGVVSPMLQAGLGRADIEYFCRQFDLPFVDRPPESCLATRIKTGQHLDKALLARLDTLEEAIHSRGIPVVRARYNLGEIRLQVRKDDIPLIITQRNEISKLIRDMGFELGSVDLMGYDENKSLYGETIS